MVYSSFVRGGWEQVGGTSLGAPAWAAIVATVDSQAHTSLGSAQVLNALYGISALSLPDFNKVSTSASSLGIPNTFATTTYNTSTGLGTPRAKLLSDLTILASISGDTNPVVTTSITAVPPSIRAATATPSSQAGAGTRTSTSTPTSGQYPSGWWPGGWYFAATGDSGVAFGGSKYSVIGSSGGRRV